MRKRFIISDMPITKSPQHGADHAETAERSLLVGLFVLGVIGICISYVPRFEYWSEIAAHIVREFGVALIIAALLGFAVDQYLKEKLVKSIATRVSQDVAENTSNYVFGYFVPDDLKQELLELMRPPVLRRNLKLNITMQPLEGRGEFMRVITKLNFTVQNLKDETISFRHQLTMSNTFVDVEIPSIRRFACRAMSRDHYEYDYKGLPALQKGEHGVQVFTSDDGMTLSVSRMIDIPPRSDEFVFWTESSEAMKVPYNDQFSFANATAFVEVDVNCPDDLDFILDIDKGRNVDVFSDPPERPRYWRYQGVCLAGQYISYKFRRRTELTNNGKSM